MDSSDKPFPLCLSTLPHIWESSNQKVAALAVPSTYCRLEDKTLSYVQVTAYLLSSSDFHPGIGVVKEWYWHAHPLQAT